MLDIGCGTGSFLARLAGDGHQERLCGADMSPAAVQAAATIPGVDALLADAVNLPLIDASFDVVAARHMLYHVTDLSAALRECRRVLAPNGRFVAVVNRRNATPHVARLVHAAVRDHGLDVPEQPNDRVHSDNLPAEVEVVFGHVKVRHYDNAFVFAEPGPLVRYAVALLNFAGVGDANELRPLVVDSIRQSAHRWFEQHPGPWRDPKGYTVCVARRPFPR